MLSPDQARMFAKHAVDRWLNINYLTVTDHSLGIDSDTIDKEWYESLIEEITLVFSGVF